MVDLLGLTDSTVALHPENILGPRVYWKERNYNTRHVLSLNPAYVYFSTGVKPSAAAERALFLRTRFRVGYYPCFITVSDGRGWFTEYIYRAKPGADTLPVETPDVNPEFVDLYNRGINLTRSRQTLDSAIAVFHQCLAVAPPDFAYPWEWIGVTQMQLRREDAAIVALEQALALDDWCVTAHEALGTIQHNRGRYDVSASHFAAVMAHAPDYVAGYMNCAASTAALGDFAAAERILLEAKTRFPTMPQVQEQLSRVRAAASRARAPQPAAVPPAGD
jgi:Flp pilus assembly protein TadD